VIFLFSKPKIWESDSHLVGDFGGDGATDESIRIREAQRVWVRLSISRHSYRIPEHVLSLVCLNRNVGDEFVPVLGGHLVHLGDAIDVVGIEENRKGAIEVFRPEGHSELMHFPSGCFPLGIRDELRLVRSHAYL